jgi:hypothetical protein
MKVLAVLVALAVAATLTTYINQAQAVITTPFDTTFAANTNGAIVLRGNSNLTCPPAATGCTDALSGVGATTGEALNNNGYNMVNRTSTPTPRRSTRAPRTSRCRPAARCCSPGSTGAPT